MTNQNAVLEKWRGEFAKPNNSDDWWTRLRAMDMFLELQAEVYRLQGGEDEPPVIRCPECGATPNTEVVVHWQHECTHDAETTTESTASCPVNPGESS